MLRLFLLFTLVPAIELYLLILIGQYMGAVPTVLLILVTGFLGSFLAKREGLSVLRQLQADLQRGIPPADRLVEGVLVLVGGVLLITPGIISDLAGFALIMPWTRRALAPVVRRALLKRFTLGDLPLDADNPYTAEADPRAQDRARSRTRTGGTYDHPVIE